MSEPTRRRLGWVNALRWLLVVVVAVGVVLALSSSWPEVSRELGRIAPGTWILALVLWLLAPVFTLLGWRAMLADLGSPLHLAPAASMFLVGQLGKYVPGSVWSVVAQAEMGARLGIPRRRSGVVGLLAIGLALHTGLLVGLPALPHLLDREGAAPTWWPALLVVPLLLLLWPGLLNRLIALGLRLLRREPLEHDLSGRVIAVTTVWFVLAWLVTGGAVWVLARSFGELSAGATVAALCGTALASVVGMFAFLFPAGFGIRDGVLLLLLGPHLGVGAATAVAVLARFGTIVADVLCAGFGWLWGRRHDLLGSRS